MPKSAAQKLKRKLKRKVKSAEKKAVKSVVKAELLPMTGKGDYNPQFRRVRGKGGYFSDMAGNIARPIGSILDTGAGLLKMIGIGDYKARTAAINKKFRENHGGRLSKNFDAGEILSYIGGNDNPLNMGAMNATFSTGKNYVEVVHREYISDITGTSVFNTAAYRINPALSAPGSTLFPWASQMAVLFQKYELIQCIMEYHSTSSDFSSVSALGSVSMSTIYDAAQTPYSTYSQVNNSAFTTSDKPSCSFIHPIELENIVGGPKFVHQDNSLESGADERLEDIGIFQITTIGNNGRNKMGELWITYKFRFYYPQLPTGGAISYVSSNQPSNSNYGMWPWDNQIINSSNSLVASFSGNDVTGQGVLQFGNSIGTDVVNTIFQPGAYCINISGISQIPGSAVPYVFAIGLGSAFQPIDLLTDSVLGTYADSFMDQYDSVLAFGSNYVYISSTVMYVLYTPTSNAPDNAITTNFTIIGSPGIINGGWTTTITQLDAQTTTRFAFIKDKRLRALNDKIDRLTKMIDSSKSRFTCSCGKADGVYNDNKCFNCFNVNRDKKSITIECKEPDSAVVI